MVEEAILLEYEADVAAHTKAFRGYMAKGTDNGLMALEQKALANSTNSGADGGFAVPKVIDSLIESLVVNISPIRALANVVQISVGASRFVQADLRNLAGLAPMEG